MTIESIVPLVERIVDDGRNDARLAFFSYRHAQEMHALGLKHEFTTDSSRWTQVCASIVVSTLIAPKIWVRILWSRPEIELPPEECQPWEFPISDNGVRSFAKAWPKIRILLEQAVARGCPPDRSNPQPSKSTRSARG
jgi:hypothetical protein